MVLIVFFLCKEKLNNLTDQIRFLTIKIFLILKSFTLLELFVFKNISKLTLLCICMF